MAFSQPIKKTLPDPESLITDLYRQQQELDISYEDFYEILYQFYLTPMDLNHASPEELRSLYILNDQQIDEILTHIKKYGNLISLYELQSLPNFSIETIQKLLPFVTAKTEEYGWKGLGKQLKKSDQHYLLLRYSYDLQQARGYPSANNTSAAYVGDPSHVYTRYRIQKYQHYSFGITAEKDPGEPLEFRPSKKKYGPDFLSFHAMIYNKGLVKRLLIGDYQLQFGQGLVLSGGFFVGKGAETVLSTRRGSVGIRPYTSAFEDLYLRGIAATFGNKKWSITPFISQRDRDGSLSTSDTTFHDATATLRHTGLHRTEREMAGRAAVKELVAGANIEYLSDSKKLQLGTNILGIQYDKNINPPDKLYTLHDFKGKDNYNTSIYYSYLWRNASFFGEMGVSKNGGKGWVQGMMLALGTKAEATLLYRNYQPNFHATYGNSFGENFRNSNETGIYWGLKLRPARKWEINLYYDIFHFPWLKYRVSTPSTGNESLIAVRYKFNKKIQMLALLRNETKQQDIENELQPQQKLLSDYSRKNISLQLEWKADKRVYLKSKVQASSYHNKLPSYGFLISQDIGMEGRIVDIAARIALFDTDNFENRQYTFEKDVLFMANMPFFSGKGMRQFVLTSFRVGKKITLWLKYGRTIYFDREKIGTGHEEIRGNEKSEIRCQIRYNFK